MANPNPADVQMIEEQARATATQLRLRGVEPTRWGDGKGTFVQAWDLHIFYNSIKEEGYTPNGYREYYSYYALLLKHDGSLFSRRTYEEKFYRNGGEEASGEHVFSAVSASYLLLRDDISVSEITEALERLAGPASDFIQVPDALRPDEI